MHHAAMANKKDMMFALARLGCDWRARADGIDGATASFVLCGQHGKTTRQQVRCLVGSGGLGLLSGDVVGAWQGGMEPGLQLSHLFVFLPLPARLILRLPACLCPPACLPALLPAEASGCKA
jgi:hypothetical protein